MAIDIESIDREKIKRIIKNNAPKEDRLEILRMIREEIRKKTKIIPEMITIANGTNKISKIAYVGDIEHPLVYMSYERVYSKNPKKRGLVINWFHVDGFSNLGSSLKGLSLGTEFMNHMIRGFKSEGYNYLELRCPEQRVEFYKRLGFVVKSSTTNDLLEDQPYKTFKMSMDL